MLYAYDSSSFDFLPSRENPYPVLTADQYLRYVGDYPTAHAIIKRDKSVLEHLRRFCIWAAGKDMIAGIMLFDIVKFHQLDREDKHARLRNWGKDTHLWLVKQQQYWADEFFVAADTIGKKLQKLAKLGVIQKYAGYTSLSEYRRADGNNGRAMHIRILWDNLTQKLEDFVKAEQVDIDLSAFQFPKVDDQPQNSADKDSPASPTSEPETPSNTNSLETPQNTVSKERVIEQPEISEAASKSVSLETPANTVSSSTEVTDKTPSSIQKDIPSDALQPEEALHALIEMVGELGKYSITQKTSKLEQAARELIAMGIKPEEIKQITLDWVVRRLSYKDPDQRNPPNVEQIIKEVLWLQTTDKPAAYTDKYAHITDPEIRRFREIIDNL